MGYPRRDAASHILSRSIRVGSVESVPARIALVLSARVVADGSKRVPLETHAPSHSHNKLVHIGRLQSSLLARIHAPRLPPAWLALAVPQTALSRATQRLRFRHAPRL
jgi:hypothetical protein